MPAQQRFIARQTDDTEAESDDAEGAHRHGNPLLRPHARAGADTGRLIWTGTRAAILTWTQHHTVEDWNYLGEAVQKTRLKRSILRAATS